MLIDLYVVLAVATKVRAVGLGLATPEAITNNWRPIHIYRNATTNLLHEYFNFTGRD